MAKGRVPKSITVKIPKALRKSRLVKSLLANKVDYDRLASAFVAAGSAAALALTRQSAGERQASEPAQAGWLVATSWFGSERMALDPIMLRGKATQKTAMPSTPMMASSPPLGEYGRLLECSPAGAGSGPYLLPP